MTTETGVQADLRRSGTLVRPDGSVVIPARLTPWVRSLIDAAVRDLRRAGRGGNFGADVLEMLDALTLSEVSPKGPLIRGESRIEVDGSGDASGEILTSARAAELLQCTPRSVTRACRAGRLRGRLVGYTWLIYERDLAEYRHNKRE